MPPPAWAYQVDVFDPPPDEELVCSICRAVFCDPVRSACNHVFCRICITKWLENNRNCPICRKRTTRNNIHEVVPLIKNMIMKLTLKCHNEEVGCEEKFSLEGCEGHVKDCAYETIQCKNKPCKQMMQRKDIHDHESQSCPHRYIRCKKCGLKVSSVLPVPQRHNCIKALQKCLKDKIAVIKKKKQKIKELQNEIKTLKQNERVNTPNSSLDSMISEAIMVNFTDMDDISSISSISTLSSSDSFVSNSGTEDDESQWIPPTSEILNSLERRLQQRESRFPERFDDSIEFPRSSSPILSPSRASANSESFSLDDEPVRRPAKRRLPLILSDSSNEDAADEFRFISLPSPKRIWRNGMSSRDEAPQTLETSGFAASASEAVAGTSFQQATSDASSAGTSVPSYLRPRLMEDIRSPTVPVTPAVGPRRGENFERTLALLSKYNLESDPEWLPTDLSVEDNDNDSLIGSHSSIAQQQSFSSNSEESNPEEVDSEDLFMHVSNKRRVFKDNDSSSDDDLDWKPNWNE